MRFFDIIDEQGKLSPQRSEAIRQKLLDMAGQKVVIEIKQGGRRSQNQNAFYFGVVIPAVKELFEQHGDSVSPDDVHLYLKEHVAGMVKVMVAPDGKRTAIVETSTKLTTAEWEEYILKIRAWAAQWGVDIPEPTKQGIENQLFERTLIAQ